MPDILLNTATAAASAGFTLKDAIPMAPALVALAALWFSDASNRRTLKAAKENAETAAWQKANEEELKTIQDRLDGFYGPFRTMSEVNKLMNLDLRNRQPDPKTFILIEKLFDKRWRNSLPDGEQAMLREIATNAEKLRTFIESKVGMVDEKVFPYIARASAHYRILELAYKQELGDEAAPFVARYVFPRRIEDVLRLEVARLKGRRDELKAAPFKAHSTMPPLVIPTEYALPEWPYPPRDERSGLTAPIT